MTCVKRTRGTLARVPNPPPNEPYRSEPGAQGYSAARRPACKPARTSLMILVTNSSRSAGERRVMGRSKGVIASDGHGLAILVHRDDLAVVAVIRAADKTETEAGLVRHTSGPGEVSSARHPPARYRAGPGDN